MNVEQTLRELNQINNKVYTRIVNEAMKPNILSIYEHVKLKIGYNKEIWYGDADVYVSIEPAYVKYKEEHDVLIIKNVVSCFERGVVVAIVNKKTGDIPLCKCVESHGVKREGWDFGDHRDWEVEGLDTLRDHNWKFGYEDLRDDSLVFKRESYWEDVRPDKPYNDWHRASHGCGFLVDNLLYAEREIRWTYHMVVEDEAYTICDEE
ncbi:hypothetical protein phiST2_0348 [Vibrio phage phi-ST2]|uniref:Acyl-ACP thioesterase-like C-terminal domain-containing protein n=1 Tax=Vibrio phage VH7D TaxID=1262539 RepID=V9M0F2_9CAUD|nr:hypothetical protein CF80_gp321 [Vibrio phage VH7D]ALP47445.1 hypothetical protein phiST2_0348 [Vibrio phage phi-ST2]QBX05987.1 hypothetical protein Va3_033 [Vibrio phage Va3]QNJ54612.1 hypothetical protein vBValMR10Z_71 [Vibrio phage vB_ValM_R10Z]QNJ54997.1 hypothetical protein vBValMR11Z_71 [Vibrio phage vB_ValM_R11Z]URQ03686.1 hypothetical protein PVA23_309 [Vibrio phage PVA23]